jgi:16S rRNA (guanine527-N7)-methyltransferase
MFHVKHRDWGRALAALAVDLPSGAVAKLSGFEALLAERAIPAGLIAAGDRDHIGERHILDSLRAAPLIGDERWVVDLGSGAGLPGIPLAVARPEARFLLTDTRRTRVAFLELAIERLELVNATVRLGPAERVDTAAQGDPSPDVCTARAFGDLMRSWQVASRLLRPRGTLLYWAGRRWRPPEDLPDGTTLRVASVPGFDALANAGPVVIMSRQ